MKVSVFTPTQRPGIDVTHFSLMRQITEAKIQWIVSDELMDERLEDETCRLASTHLDVNYKWFNIKKREGFVRNLAASYNQAMEIARRWDADLFVSLQDYIWVPEDGIQKWVDMYRAVDNGDGYNGIYTGLCSITSDPAPDKVKNPNGMFSIFEKHYSEQPQNIEWMDIRYKKDFHYASVPQIEFETNWACIPRSSLYNDDLYFDEEFDKAVAYENQDYAYRARSLQIDTLIDMKNRVLSLPHKKYFAESWAFEQPLTDINRKICEEKWGHFQGLL